MDRSTKNVTALLAVGGLLSCTLVEHQSREDQPEQPHGEYQSVAPNVNVSIAPSGGPISNVSAQLVSLSYRPAVLNLEWLLPHEHLVVQTSELTFPTERTPSNTTIPATGADPFFHRRPRGLRIEVSAPQLPPFWCSSSQRFRPRRA